MLGWLLICLTGGSYIEPMSLALLLLAPGTKYQVSLHASIHGLRSVFEVVLLLISRVLEVLLHSLDRLH